MKDRSDYLSLVNATKGVDLSALPDALRHWITHELAEGEPNCNGWANHETWCVNLWISNDQGLYEYWRETAREIADGARSEGVFTREESAMIALADRLKTEMAEDGEWMKKLGDTALEIDLLGAAFSEVQWDEVARCLLQDVDFETEEGGAQ